MLPISVSRKPLDSGSSYRYATGVLHRCHTPDDPSLMKTILLLLALCALALFSTSCASTQPSGGGSFPSGST